MIFKTKHLTIISILLILILLTAPFLVFSDDWDDVEYEDWDDVEYEDWDDVEYEDWDDIEYDDYGNARKPEKVQDKKERPKQKPEQKPSETHNDFDEIDEITDIPGDVDPDLPNDDKPEDKPEDKPDDEPEDPFISEVEGVGLHISAARYDNQINAGDQLLFTVYLKNNGDVDLDNTEVTIINQELALRAHAGPFDFNDGFKAKKKLLIDFPSEVESGTYYLRIIVHNNDVHRVVYREIDIV